VALYEHPVRILMREMADALQLAPGQLFSREDALRWFEKHYPLVKQGTIVAHLTRLSTNNRTRLNYAPRADDDVFFQVNSRQFRRYDTASDPAPIHDGPADGTPLPDDAIETESKAKR